MISSIVVHQKLVNTFKRKAVKAIPQEIIVAILGKMDEDILYIHAFDYLDIDKHNSTAKKITITYSQPEEEIEAGTKLKYFGTLHSHPNSTIEPTDVDISEFRKVFNAEPVVLDGEEVEYLHDEIMGIMSVTKKKKVIQYNLVFYNIDLEPIPISYSETTDNA